MNDVINHPTHYCEGRKYEPIDVILDWDLSFCLGQVVKYVSRAGRKGDTLEDLRKAEFYLTRAITDLAPKKQGRCRYDETGGDGDHFCTNKQCQALLVGVGTCDGCPAYEPEGGLS